MKKSNNEFVESIKQDVETSQSISMIKDKTKSTFEKMQTADSTQKNKIKKISIAALVIIVLLTVVTHIHKCDDCEKVYFGSKHTITYWGETEDLCKECYDDFYSFK